MSSKNILFITLLRIESLDDRGIYHDLLRDLKNKGHKIFVVSPFERRYNLNSKLNIIKQTQILNVKILNIQKTNLIEKTLSTLTMEYLFLNAIKKYYSDIKFDLIIYSTPPITITKIISYIKKKNGAYSYLLLKDIFPQNAVDLKFIKKDSLIHKFFLRKEKKLYDLSDRIGCMSLANYNYIIKNNPRIDFKKLEINPNSIEPLDINILSHQKDFIRSKYSLPLNKKIFIYGGNLGKPQGLDFLLDSIKSTVRLDVFYLIIGSGTEYVRIQKWFEFNQPKNAMLINNLPKFEYDKLLSVCDVGLIFLSPNFTIPNYPSRLLSYLEMKLPVITATDIHTDIGKDIEDYECGFSVISGNSKDMEIAIDKVITSLSISDGIKNNAYKLLIEKFNINKSSELILNATSNN
jgi:glycosyltransferase involved in cell wall biosynthesis